MLTTYALVIPEGVLVVIALLGTVCFVWGAILARRGARSSPPPKTEPTWSPRKPSFEHSGTSSTVSITVPANPALPLAYSAEPVPGSSRLVKLTVLYEQSLGDSESAILKSVAFDSKPRGAFPMDVEDPAWLDYINQTREKL